MKIEINIENGTKKILTEKKDLDGEDIVVGFANGFGACDVVVGYQTMRWSDFDALKAAMVLAEERWRK